MNVLKFLPSSLANALRWPKGWLLMRREWNARIADVLSSADNARLPRVAHAGKIKNGWQTMHNGLQVLVDGYYGSGITRMLKANKGCHEPQEEIVFAEVLKRLPTNPVIIECGSYWAFYSMWLLKERPGGRAFMIEPDPSNLEVGRKNFQHNGFSGHFEQAGLGGLPGSDAQIGRIVSVASFMASKQLERVDVLHMDIQGAELSTLSGALPLFLERRIDYVFVSSHSEELHAHCVTLLHQAGYEVDVSVPMRDSNSVDGIIVAKSPALSGTPLPSPSPKQGILGCHK